jgi:hypothetical protein
MRWHRLTSPPDGVSRLRVYREEYDNPLVWSTPSSTSKGS